MTSPISISNLALVQADACRAARRLFCKRDAFMHAARTVRYGAFLALIGLTVAHAQVWPERSIRMIVPYPAGGTADGLVRSMLPRLTELLGQPILVDNKSGANGILGTDIAAKATPDGYTLVLSAIGPMAVSPAMQKLPYDPLKDLVPIAFFASVPNVLVVNPSMPVRSVAELVALAKSKPGQLNYGSAGVASSNQLAAELFNRAAGVDIVHVPYRGGAPAVADLIGGHLSLIFDNAPSAIPHAKAGTLRALAVTSPTRLAALPDVPTMVELGYANFEAGSWFGLLAPIGTPPAVIARLNKAVVDTMRTSSISDNLIQSGFDLRPGTPENFAAFIRSETGKWATVVKAAGISNP